MKRKGRTQPVVLQATSEASEWLPIMKVEAGKLHEFESQSLVEKEEGTVDADAAPPRHAMPMTSYAKSLLEARLSQPSGRAYPAASDQEIEENLYLYNTSTMKAAFGHDDRAVAVPSFSHSALNVYTKVIESLLLEPSDGTSSIVKIDGSHGSVFTGGFGKGTKSLEGYQKVNVPVFDQAQQSTCVFAFTNKAAILKVSPAFKLIMDDVQTKAEAALGFALVPTETHLCLGFNRHSHFIYHQDDQGEFTVVVQYSPGRSTLHIAGATTEIIFENPGDAFLFPSLAYHRSGEKQRRTVTASHFFKRKKETSQTASKGEASGSSMAAPPDIDIKPEVKAEAD